MANPNCEPGECDDPKYTTPVKVKPFPTVGGGGHLFVTSLPLPEEASAGAEYVLMDDLSDPSTYKGTYILNPETNSFIASSGGGGSTVVVDNALSTTSPNPVQNKVITTELNKKAGKDEIPDISGLQEKLISGENIKTINGQSILGRGNIKIEGGGGGTMGETFTTNIAVGGIPSGTTINADDDVASIIKRMLTTVYYPTFTAPSATLNYNTPTLVKVGANIPALTATVVFNAGAITLQGVKQANRAGNATEYSVATSGAATDYNESKATNSFSVPALTRTTKGNITVVGSVKYAQGPQPKDSNGDDYGSPLAAGSVNTATKTFEFILPFCYGVSNTPTISDITGLTEVLEKKGEKKYTYSTNNQHMVIAYDASYGNLTSIKDPNNFETVDSWNKSVLTVDGNQYNVYISQTAPTNPSAEYTFKF